MNAIVCGTFHTDSFARVDADRGAAGADGRERQPAAASRPPTRSSAPRSFSRATRRRTSPASCSCSTAAEPARTRTTDEETRHDGLRDDVIGPGRVAVVTGAASGIGRALAEALRRRGLRGRRRRPRRRRGRGGRGRHPRRRAARPRRCASTCPMPPRSSSSRRRRSSASDGSTCCATTPACRRST